MIEFFHVGKVYSGLDRPVLHDLSFNIGRGDFCVLTGPSGAGKSTLLKLISATERPSYGDILLSGKSISTASSSEIVKLRRQIGFVFQDFRLIPYLSVADNVAMPLRVQGESPANARRRAIDYLELVGLAAKMHTQARALSGGEQQRASIARALVNEPELILCDEPTGSLDARRSNDVVDLLGQAHRRGTTVVVASHQPALFAKSVKKLITLKEGRLEGENL